MSVESVHIGIAFVGITMAPISVSIQVFPLGNYQLEVPSDWTIDQVRQKLANNYTEFADLASENTLVFIAQSALGSFTLRELGVDIGSAIFFAIAKSVTTLELSLFNETRPRVRIPATQRRALVGRNDSEFTETLTVDLEPLLREIGGDVSKVSRGQAWLIFSDGRWFVQPYDGAKAPVFVNGQQVNQSDRTVLQEADVLAFGIKQGNPVLQLIVHYAIE